MKKKLLAVLMTGIMAMSFAATTTAVYAKGDDDNTLTVWAWDQNFNIKAMNIAGEQYAKDHEGFKVDVVETSSDDCQTKLTTAANAGDYSTLPDIVLMQDNSYQKYLKSYPDAFTDLKDMDINWDDFGKLKQSYSMVDDTHYGVPFDNGATIACYRTDILEEAGYTIDDLTDITWSKFMEIGKDVHEKTGKYLLTSEATGGDTLMMMIQSCGANFVNDDGEAYIVGNDVAEKCVDLYVDLVKNNVVKLVNNWDEYISTITGERAAGKLREDLELIQGVYPSLDRQEYLDAHVAPVFFGSALNNFGIRELLDCFIEIAPAPLARETEERPVRPEEEKFTGFVFKIHANMDPNHRDRIAFVKICSGIFKRNTNYLHVRNGKMLKFSTPTAFMASKKSVIDEAYPGDIIGLHDTGTFKIGDTLTEGEKLHFKGIPSFSPELFKYIENADPMKSKQLAKGIDQLMDEGVAQLFVSQFNNRKIIGTVGALQFEVIEYRLLHEYAAACRWEPINLYKACWIEAQDQAELEDFKKHKAQYMAKDKEGRDVFLADSQYMLHMAQENYKKLIFHFTSEF